MKYHVRVYIKVLPFWSPCVAVNVHIDAWPKLKTGLDVVANHFREISYTFALV
jgi:hypothetical protein